jgi:ribonuclease BN (tRNA processing enzyme)
MKTRIQLIENSRIHRVPSILLTVHRTQFLFNVIPTLLRHRRNHKLNLYNSFHIFFTKNHIEALGGLTNLLLFRSAAEHSKKVVANKVHIFADKQIFNHLEKLRFKLGYKILRTSYCQMDAARKRIGVTKPALLNILKNDPNFPHKFATIDEHLK